MLFIFILSVICVLLSIIAIILDIFCEKVGWMSLGAFLILGFFIPVAVGALREYNTVCTVTTYYLDKEISYPVDVEVIRTEKAATKHQEEIAEKLYNDLNRVDSTWTIETKDNNIIVSNGEKHYVFYRIPCRIKSK